MRHLAELGCVLLRRNVCGSNSIRTSSTELRFLMFNREDMSSDSFATLGLHDNFCDTLTKLGFDEPTPIQLESIPIVLEGKDVLGLAQTGTGKTAAFGLPLLQNIQQIKKGRAEPKAPRSLVLAPTRELALQIHAELEKFSAKTSLYVACVIGGVGQSAQVKKLYSGVDVLIAAPGRLLDLMNQGHVELNKTSFLVLDECDRLLDMGFIPDVRRILSKMPDTRQTMLFSATMPKEISRFAQETLKDPVKINVAPKEISVAKTEQHIYKVSKGEKPRALLQLLRRKSLRRAIVFTRTKHGANRITGLLNKSGFVAEVIHGNKSQAARQRAILNFKKGRAWVLVATDIAARGLDIQDVSHVINLELPQDPESYVHRIGRTGRAGAEGVAWSLVDETERSKVKTIERLIRKEIAVTELQIDKVDEVLLFGESKKSKEESPRRSQSRNGRSKRARIISDDGSDSKRQRAKSSRSKTVKTGAKKNKSGGATVGKKTNGRNFSETTSTRKQNSRQNGKGRVFASEESLPEGSSSKGNRRPRKRAITT